MSAAVIGGLAISAYSAYSTNKNQKEAGKNKVKWTEPQSSLDARSRIEASATTSAGQIPLQGVADFSPEEQKALDLAMEFMQDETGSVTIDRAIDVATQIAEQGFDINSPEVRGLVAEIRKTGDFALNRIGRQLENTGGFSSSGGRDILGRSVSDTENRTAAALIPLMLGTKTNQLNAANLTGSLVGQKRTGQLTRIATGSAAGESITNLQQRIQDAIFQRKQSQFDFNTAGRANINSLLLQSPFGTVAPIPPDQASNIAGGLETGVSVMDNLSKILGSGNKTTTTPTGTGVNSPNFDPGGELSI